MAETGYLLFSLDTELAWGHFDCFDPCLFSLSGDRERKSIRRLLAILDEYEITATWALVGQLFHNFSYPDKWRGQYPAFERLYASGSRLLRGADVVADLLEHGANHEFAYHGQTHALFDEQNMTREDALWEIETWIEAAQQWNITPHTVIFPRNRVGYLDLFRQAGFICYRGQEILPTGYQRPLIGKFLRHLHDYAPLATARAYDPTIEKNGLVNLPASRWLFGFKPAVAKTIRRLHFEKLSLKSIYDGLTIASSEKKVIHLWAHPYEFRTDQDFERLHLVFDAARKFIDEGTLQSVSMSELAQRVTQSFDVS